jgi:SNF2 family DNA or RNA helicase
MSERTLKTALRPHQRQALEFVEERGGRAILALDMGAGKTLTALAHAATVKRTLVIVPKKLIRSWLDQIVEHTTLGWQVWERDAESVKTDVDVTLCTYETFRDRRCGFVPDLVICDEAHALNNSRTLLYRRSWKRLCMVRNLLLLSATPAKNRPREWWALVNLVDKGFMTKTDFEERFCDGHWEDVFVKGGGGATRSVWVATGSSNQGELEDLLRGYGVGVRLEDVWDGPPLRHKIVECQIDDAPGAMKGFRQKRELALAKVEKTLEVLLAIESKERQVVCFSEYPEVLERLNVLGDSRVLSAGLSQDKRDALVEAFKQGTFSVLLSTLKLGGEGLNLPEATVVVFNDVPFTPAGLYQALRRAWRPGQTKPVTVVYVLAKGNPTEEWLRQMVDAKAKVASQVDLRRQTG